MLLLLLFRRLAFAADLSPAQVDRSNYLALENQANLHAYYPRPPPRPFGLALGALVTVKLVSLRRGGKAGRSVGSGLVSGGSRVCLNSYLFQRRLSPLATNCP